ncbi:cohesin subunit SA-1 [Ixodes scapularis]|uniref:Stromal antigen, putative n=1 Tax=Ixodes scapularis TaxID=6945 RepID=B7P7Z7_IXOSC|nr:cohesin subunit SA-1 [Ixodes scapularis]EEC02719.1 stromal antigen, putative [Ixodes scapularis]|eukprot:XP_002400453.1 stromal antigen, putative [Ixodes scapularis]
MILRNAIAGRKRTRQSEDDGTDHSGLDPDDFFLDLDDGLNESNDNSSEVEFGARARGKRRRVGEGGRGRGRGRGGGRGRGARRNVSSEGITSEDPSSLYEIVKQGRHSLTAVVDDWIESYKQDKDAALLDLMTFFFHCSGCKGRITPQMQVTMEHTQIIRKMTEEFDEDSGDYPLIMAGPQWKKFRQSFCEFVQVLVRQCQYSIIYDQFLMDNLISILTGLSDSQVRAFRHTSTLAAMKLMTALVDVALNLSISLDNTQRQYEAERQKNKDKRATERLELLMTKRQDLEENTEEIKNMLTYMFKSVFVHRYRDTLPEVRSICMLEIGQWMKKFHQHFLDDSYLKYLGWTLHDKVGDVRLRCLQALLPLYASEELTSKMELFTNKFKDRIVTMTLDKEYEVAVHAAKLVISIHKFHREILTDKDCEHVYELVYSSHRAVAQAAGEFLNERLFQPDEAAVQGLRTRRGKKRSVNTPLIRDLVQFFIESELHEHGAYLVDSLIESNPMMKDWECMTDLLLEEPGPDEEQLDDRQETSLIEIMVCCTKQAATGEPPVGRGPNRKQMSNKEMKQVADDRVKLTEHFIQALPSLLSKYIADQEKIANLMVLPQYFDLEIYTSSRQEKSLDSLLKLIQEIVERHDDTEVLETCARTYEALCSEELAVHSRCAVSRGTLVDSLVGRYKHALMAYAEAGEEADDDDIYAVQSALKKVSIFYVCHNLGPWTIWEGIFEFWVKGAGERTLSLEGVRHAISCCSSGIMWDLAVLDEGNIQMVHVHALRARLREFMDTMVHMLRHCTGVLQEEAFVTICDLLIIFCRQLGEGEPFSALVFEPDRSLQANLSEFIQNNVFVEDDTAAEDEQDEHRKIEELHKRRNFLASFCKLVVYNVISVRPAADVFKHYVRFYNDYGDIIKATLGKAREINKVNCARTMVQSLTSLFNTLERDRLGNVSRQDEGFLAIKELAKRFALSFGLDQVKNRDSVAALHREGIVFSCTPFENPHNALGPPPNLPFLELLCEFTNKLMKQDKKVVLQYLDRHVQAKLPASRADDWQPLQLYRTSLVHGEAEQTVARAPGRQYRGRKRQREDDGHVGEEEEVDQDSDRGSESEFRH